MPEPGQLLARVVAKSDPGRDPDKQVNEDAFGVTAIGGSLLAVVCDGMGGHAGGRLASHAAVDSILKELAASDPASPTRQRLQHAIVQASAAVHRIGGDAPAYERPGATCVALWLHAETLHVAHVGDSRGYRWRSGILLPLTRDHSVIEAWIQAGQVSREQARLHPDAHRITRALGIESTVEVELRPPEALMPGDKFLLCSDGLTDLVTEAELAEALGASRPLEELTDELVLLANIRGGHDNVTAVLLQVTDPTLVADPLDPNASPPHYVLSTPAVLAVPTEQFEPCHARSAPTVSLETTDRTVLMDEVPANPPTQSSQSVPTAGRAIGNTQPLIRVDVPATLQHRPKASNPMASPLVGQKPRRIWLVLGITLLLIGFAIAYGLIRRR
jgi:PPM family protein phosphatase